MMATKHLWCNAIIPALKQCNYPQEQPLVQGHTARGVRVTSAYYLGKGGAAAEDLPAVHGGNEALQLVNDG